MSSRISDVRRSRSSRAMPGLVVEQPAHVRGDAVAELVRVDRDVEQLRPELGDDAHVDLVLELGERLLFSHRAALAGDSLVEFHELGLSSEEPTAGGRRAGGIGAAAIAGTGADGGDGLAREQVGEPPERLGRLGLGPSDDDRDALVHRARDLAVGRDEDVRRAAENRLDIRLADARRGCARGSAAGRCDRCRTS